MLLSKDCVEMLESMYDHPENHLDESPDNSCMETLADLGFISTRRVYEDDDESFLGVKVVYSPYQITNSGRAYVETVRQTRAETAEANKKSQEVKIMSIISIVISAAAVIVPSILHFI